MEAPVPAIRDISLGVAAALRGTFGGMLGATSRQIEQSRLQRCVLTYFTAWPRSEKAALANDAHHRRHVGADLANKLRVELVIHTNGSGKIPGVE
jgi:hypothetical protein